MVLFGVTGGQVVAGFEGVGFGLGGDVSGVGGFLAVAELSALEHGDCAALAGVSGDGFVLSLGVLEIA
jgi:hypothetical protein